MLTVLSYGCGQDSHTLLLQYIHDGGFRAAYAPHHFVVVMSDTGDEHPHTYRYLEDVTKHLCNRCSINFVLLTPDMGFHTPAWQSLRQAYTSKSMIGSPAFGKVCTDKLKIVPIYKYIDWLVADRYGYKYDGRKGALRQYVKAYGKVVVLLGIAKGEEKRVAKAAAGPKWMQDCIEKVYPLIERGYDRAACQAYIETKGRGVPWPSNCVLCHFMSPRELLWLARFMPDDLKAWVAMEEAKIKRDDDRGRDPKKNYGVWGRISIMDKLAKAEAEFGHMTNEELSDYKFSHGHCVKNAY
jgi:3'-phosphoadenosine 5'-phosphosulfate sulfotransferase (PAPS reductase)/FAD synthetase